MWVSVNFNEISRTICLLTDSNKELYKFLVLGQDIPYFDFNVQHKSTTKILSSTKEMNKIFDDQFYVDYGLDPASFLYFMIKNTFSLNQIMIVFFIIFLIMKIVSLFH